MVRATMNTDNVLYVSMENPSKGLKLRIDESRMYAVPMLMVSGLDLLVA